MGETMARQRIAVLGGCGHVGLPLALTFAARGCDVDVVDVSAEAVAATNAGRMRFLEEGAADLLAAHAGKNLVATTDASVVARASTIICVVGTPIDEHLNPQMAKLVRVMDDLKPHLRPGQLFALRSTVYPGATLRIARWCEENVPGVLVAFCPERVAQGIAIREIQELPQIVSGCTPEALARARSLFAIIADKLIELEPTEAELAKLFCNAWRYISFATANQFYALCMQNGIDYYRVLDAIKLDYPRMKGLPSAGFAAGPCLFKDTMQLAAYYRNEFSLGQSAMLVNEGLPLVLMQELRKLDLRGSVVGILGMAFKAGSDDTRDSLAFKLKKLLALECRDVLCTDEHVTAPWVLPLEEVLSRSDVLVVGVPHERYRGLSPRQPTLDPWNHLGRGGLMK
ncbi:MAG: nucleotide sugar dehydrogenase [Acidobacteriota bacterium]